MSQEAERPELEAVRRLLAEARHDEPMPDDVAARMDRVLADLAALGDRRDDREGAPVVSLAGHRRRRAAALLVAAAAIVVGGVTVAQYLPGHSQGTSTAGGSPAYDRSGTSPPSSSLEPSPDSPGHGLDRKLLQLKTRAGRVLVRPRHFTADALTARQATGPTRGYATDGVRLSRVSPGCVPPLGDAAVLPATYRKAPAALVYHAPAGATQVVDLYVCGTSKPVRTVTLPTP